MTSERKKTSIAQKAKVSIDASNHNLVTNIEALNRILEKIAQPKIVSMVSSPWRWFLFNLNAGIARGLGTVLGATVVLGIVLFVLSQIALVPVIGTFVKQILNYINQNTNLSKP